MAERQGSLLLRHAGDQQLEHLCKWRTLAAAQRRQHHSLCLADISLQSSHGHRERHHCCRNPRPRTEPVNWRGPSRGSRSGESRHADRALQSGDCGSLRFRGFVRGQIGKDRAPRPDRYRMVRRQVATEHDLSQPGFLSRSSHLSARWQLSTGLCQWPHQLRNRSETGANLAYLFALRPRQRQKTVRGSGKLH